MSKVNEYKALLRGVLNAGIASGASAEKTIEALDIQFAGICTMCMLSNIGYKCPCERGNVCFVEDALEKNVWGGRKMELTVYNKKLIEQVFDIADVEICCAVMKTLTYVPDYFWSVPSSSSGKYHPEDELGEGGLVIHTLKDIVVCRQMAPMLNLSQREIDLCVAALILHDTCKSGYQNTGHTVHEHPMLAASLVCFCNNDSPVACEIAGLIETHMGRWNTSQHSDVVLGTPANKLQQFVHMCDMFAAQKTWDIKY